jgi:hypothetical protein
MNAHGTRAAGIAAIALLCAGALMPQAAQAAELNLATVTCDTYESQILAGTFPDYSTDPINTVMWLFGFSIAKSGERVMYGDSLKAFGFGLDAQCKNFPATSLLAAVTDVKSKRQNPMDLTRLDCATFAPRHQSLRLSDPESTTTLTMWMYGFAVGLSGINRFNPEGLAKFDAALLEHCDQHPKDSLFDALNSPNPAVPRTSPPPPPPKHQRATPKPAPQPQPPPAQPLPPPPTSP